MDTTNSANIWLPIAVVAAGLLIAGAVVWNNANPGNAGGSAGGTVDIKNVKIEGAPYVGRDDAPVTVAVWSDYQCPFCKRFELDTLPQLIKDYVDTGKAKVVFLDFAFLGNDSTDAARYGRAVWKLHPEKYYEWHHAMYVAQDDENRGFGNAASIDELTATITGIDAAKIAADVKANGAAYQAAIDADKAEAQKVGINATPSFVIGNQMIAGAYPYTTFKAAIDALLK